MDPIPIATKYLLKKGLSRVAFQIGYGMSPKSYLKQRLLTIIELYKNDRRITDELLKAFAHNVSSEDLREIAEKAGVISIMGDVLSKENIFYQFFNNPMYEIIVNYKYYTEELGKKVSQKELDKFFALAQDVINALLEI